MNPKTFIEQLARFQSFLALGLMVIALRLTSPNFLTMDNTLNVLWQISINLCLSLGILSGGIDLSVGSVLALAGAVSATNSIPSRRW
jgi:ribose transport system permease protein